jgi:hypothetical protein
VISRALTVGAVEVTAVLDVMAAFPDPLPDAFPAVEAAWDGGSPPFGTVTRDRDGRHWTGRGPRAPW